MAFTERPYAPRYSGNLFPQAVKWLLIINVALFVLYFFADVANYGGAFYRLGLIPGDVVFNLGLWQLVTYMFLHDPTGFGHILFNMLALYMFGADLEREWGTRQFLKYYFVCGVGAGVCVVVANLLFGSSLGTRTIGSSGAIYGLLIAFGVLYPNRELLFNFLFPIKAKYFVAILGAIAFMSSFRASGGGVSHLAHLGGFVCGYLYLRSFRGTTTARRRTSKPSLQTSIRDWYTKYKRDRARKKFEVYIRKHQHDRDRYTH